jgi:RNA polymerase sigma-70 factor, ECF subfamily
MLALATVHGVAIPPAGHNPGVAAKPLEHQNSDAVLVSSAPVAQMHSSIPLALESFLAPKSASKPVRQATEDSRAMLVTPTDEMPDAQTVRDGVDDALVERVKQGDKRAFDALVLKYQYRIQSVANRFVRDAAEAQDITQETFIKAYRALPHFRGDSQFYTWLYRIAVNTSKNHLLSRGRRPPTADVDADDADFYEGAEALHDNESPEGQMATHQLQAAIVTALDDLAPDLRRAITLRELDGLSYEDIAVAMRCPIGTVRSRIFRAREAIDKHIRPYIR